MSYTVIITEEVAANIAVTTTNYPITIEYNATSIESPSGSYGDSNVRSLLNTAQDVPINTTGNVQANFFVGNGSLLTGLASTYGNANVAANLAAFGSNPITTTGNITAGYFSGDGSLLTNLPAGDYSNANVAAYLPTYTGNLAGGNLSVSGNVQAANIVGNGQFLTALPGANVTGVVAQATQAGTANIALVANSVAGANVSGVVAQATQANAANTAVTVTGAAQANITSVGTLSSLSVSGNVTTSAAFLGNGAVPTGGDADTYLVKNSATNYDYAWTDRVNAKTIYENVKNISGSTLAKGTPVYQAGVTGNTITVGIARADDPAKLAVGVLDVALADQAEGRMLVLGEIKGVNTASFATGDEVYLGATGGYTNVKPTSSSVAIQFLGVVNRIDASNGSGFITGTLSPDAIKYDSYTQTWTGTAWVPTTELSSDASPALGGDLAGGAYNISTTGNITGGNLLINTDAVITGNLTVNGTTTTINSNVVTVNDKTFVLANNQSTGSGVDGSGIIAGNPAVASILYSNANTAWETNIGVRVSGAVSATGNITGSYFAGNGSTLTNLTGANVSGTVANATYATTAGSATTATSATTAGTVTDAAQGNITSVGTLSSLSVTGNITSSGNVSGNYILGNGSLLTGIAASYGNAEVEALLASGNVSTNIVTIGDITGGSLSSTSFISASGNIVGSNIIANGQYLTNLNAANVSGTVASATTAGTVTDAAQGNITSVGTLTSLSVSGNITGANLVATANLTSTQQTVVGTANVGTTGNIVVSGKNIATDMAWNPDGGNAVTGAQGRVVIGTGWAGNITHNATQSRLNTADSISRTNNATQIRQFNAESQVSLNANVTNGTFRQQGLGATVRIGGGAAANTTGLTNSPGSIFSVSGGQFNLDIGNISPYNLGNTTLSHAAINGGAISVLTGSNVTNAFGINSILTGPIGFTAGNITNYIGYSTSTTQATLGTGNVFMFYNGSNTTSSTRSVVVNNGTRAATNYYAFMNEDDVAQMQLGSLRRYHEFESATATSGSFAIDKNTAQVHNIVPTGNCTITGYSNMVVNASDGTNNDAQVDTLTIIIEQGATPYTITMPTGAAYKYAGNVSTVGATANAVTMISVTAANISGTTTYLTTISPEFV